MGDDHDHSDAQSNVNEGHEAGPTQSLSPFARITGAVEELLVERGVFSREEIQAEVDSMDTRSPTDGARVVARAWVDSEFKAQLLTDSHETLKEMGYTLPGNPVVVVVENTSDVRHLIVCTLCSCYPRTLLGRPPDWYKSVAYRSRAVTDPRGTMGEFGLKVAEDVAIRVLDSTADIRYLVLPQRPPNTDGWSEEELAALVTRDSMIGVSDPLVPAA